MHRVYAFVSVCFHHITAELFWLFSPHQSRIILKLEQQSHQGTFQMEGKRPPDWWEGYPFCEAKEVMDAKYLSNNKYCTWCAAHQRWTTILLTVSINLIHSMRCHMNHFWKVDKRHERRKNWSDWIKILHQLDSHRLQFHPHWKVQNASQITPDKCKFFKADYKNKRKRRRF